VSNREERRRCSKSAMLIVFHTAVDIAGRSLLITTHRKVADDEVVTRKFMQAHDGNI
jgi:hypothetical protein